jgi:hypothetical protein
MYFFASSLLLLLCFFFNNSRNKQTFRRQMTKIERETNFLKHSHYKIKSAWGEKAVAAPCASPQIGSCFTNMAALVLANTAPMRAIVEALLLYNSRSFAPMHLNVYNRYCLVPNLRNTL